MSDTRFLTQKLRAECDVGPRGDEWRLTESLVACWKGKRIEVLKGYNTDGASIPRLAWAIIGHPWDYYLPAAVVHDALYASEIWTRKDADECFHDLMETLSVRTIRLHLMYYAVRLGGAFTWRSHTESSIAHAMSHLRISDRCVDSTLEVPVV